MALLALSAPAGRAAADEDAAEIQAVVEGLNTTLLDVMQSADELGYEGRFERLEPRLRESFDFAFMTRIAAGRAWGQFSEEQRARLVEQFTKMSIATFAARFDGYSGERFEIAGQKPGPRDTIVVDDRIIRPEDEPVGLNFVLRPSEAGWRIIDVMLDGKFSELARQRSEFSGVLGSGGYEDLLQALEQKVQDLQASG